ncbi:MAG: tRNA lysidine(34) synthetase TilS [Lachnospiraceae bacterium]|nr:tRNA lysidine(34) synthetase TilS [Lachnospiraceae bacterium]
MLDYINQHKMIETGDKIIAGVSGGADSVCLLFVLLKLREKRNCTITVVHVNHGLRGELACRDEVFVEKLCQDLQVPYFVYHEDVSAFAKEAKMTVEEAGRVKRRQAFADAMDKTKSNKVALAHHQNDNAETLLMHLARGTGIRGMVGIRPIYGAYIRPLLSLTREEIEAYLCQRELPFCVDETNEDINFTRNRLRKKIIPQLEQINTQAIVHINESMKRLAEVEAYLQNQVDLAYEKCATKDKNSGLLIEKELYIRYPEIVQTHLIQKALYQVSGQGKDISKKHIESVCALFFKQVGRSIDLPYGMRACRIYIGVLLQKKNKEILSFEHKLKMEMCILEPSEVTPDMYSQFPYTKFFDYDIMKNGLLIRSRQPGDFITIDCAGNRQKIKSYFINEKIPINFRAQISLIADGQEIVWIVGYRTNAAYQITEKTKRVLRITITEEM